MEETKHQNFVFEQEESAREEEKSNLSSEQEEELGLPSPLQQGTQSPIIIQQPLTFQLPDEQEQHQQDNGQRKVVDGEKSLPQKQQKQIHQLQLNGLQESASLQQEEVPSRKSTVTDKYTDITPASTLQPKTGKLKQAEDKFEPKNIQKGLFKEDPKQKEDEQYTRELISKGRVKKQSQPTLQHTHPQQVAQTAQIKESVDLKKSNGESLRKTQPKLPPISRRQADKQHQNDNSPTKTANHLMGGNQSSMLYLHKSPKQQLIYQQDQFQNPLQLVYAPLPANQTKLALLTREKGCFMSYQNPRFIMQGEGRLWMNAKKQYGNINSFYNISCEEHGLHPRNQMYSGYLKGNFAGSCFNLYAKKCRDRDQGLYDFQLVATITYQTGCSSSRKIAVYIKDNIYSYQQLEGVNSDQNLNELFSVGQNASLGRIVKLVNRQPQWSSIHKCYYLNFRGKSKMPSVKNMILVRVNSPQQEALLFCKTDTNGFHMELSAPLSPFIAFGIVLTSFDYKLLCQ